MSEVVERPELRGFAPAAQAAVAKAEKEARALGHARLGTEHLLLGLLGDDKAPAARVIKRAGGTLAAARHMASEAVHPSPDVLPAGPLPTTPRGGRALVRAVRFSHQAQADEVGGEHLLLGVLDVEGTASLVLRRIGVDIDDIRAALSRLEASTDPAGATATTTTGRRTSKAAKVAPATCAGCGAPLDGNLVHHLLTATGDRGVTRDAVVFACGGCGRAIGASPA